MRGPEIEGREKPFVVAGSSAIDVPYLRDLPPRRRARRRESPRVEVLPSNGEEEGNVKPRLADSPTPLVALFHCRCAFLRAIDRTGLPRGRGDRIRDAIDAAEEPEITRVRATPRRALLLVFVIEVPSMHRDRFVAGSLPLRNSTGLPACPVLADLRVRRTDASIHRTSSPACSRFRSGFARARRGNVKLHDVGDSISCGARPRGPHPVSGERVPSH
jgi:hypothetical protein